MSPEYRIPLMHDQCLTINNQSRSLLCALIIYPQTSAASRGLTFLTCSQCEFNKLPFLEAPHHCALFLEFGGWVVSVNWPCCW